MKTLALASLPQPLHVSLTAVYQTGVSSSDPRQSHRVHPVHETKKPHTPAGYRRPEEAERSAGTARYFPTASLSQCFAGRGHSTADLGPFCYKNLNLDSATSVQTDGELKDRQPERLSVK